MIYILSFVDCIYFVAWTLSCLPMNTESQELISEASPFMGPIKGINSRDLHIS